ncbi:hypothetical protein LFZ55_08155 [Salmonella enterica subsp. diarizonae serovar 65:c:z str. SA20044251]|nr:hypothetical protein LFZ55_08155 [Salmonella enterica subsp. diarizonae serovar 65:c:z str. SA20044251]
MLLLIIPSESVLQNTPPGDDIPDGDAWRLIRPTTHEHRPDKHSAIRHSGRITQLLLWQYAFLRITEKHDYTG